MATFRLHRVFRALFSFRTLEIFGIAAAVFAAIVGVIYLEDERQDRILAREIAAWSLLRDATDTGGNVGQARALQLLQDQGANLQGVNLRNASLSFTDLTDAKLASARMENISIEWSSLKGAFLVGAKLNAARFATVDMSGAVFVAATLVDSNLFGVKLDAAEFASADLSGATIAVISSDGADFTDANLSGITLTVLGLVDGSETFSPKSSDFKAGSLEIKLLGGTVDPYDEDQRVCYAWASRARPPKSLPPGYGVVLVDDADAPGQESCAPTADSIWPWVNSP